MLHIPILRQGRVYESLEKTPLVHHASGQTIAQLSMANAGLISRDIARMNGDALQGLSIQQTIAMCQEAGQIFAAATLPVGEEKQDFERYIEQLSATTGMPKVLCRSNAEKIRLQLSNMGTVLAGLSRGCATEVLDLAFGFEQGRMLSWRREARVFGAVLPSNSPGVHTLWCPVPALKTPIVLKPGREEPWTPLRLIEAFCAAGFPREAFGYYPSDHAGAAALLAGVDRAMLFGDSATTAPYRKDPRIEVHGPGYSKVILGQDQAQRWEEHLDVMVSSILANGGRSCINASAIWTPKYAAEIAEALGKRLAAVRALGADDPQAQIAAFADPRVATRISNMIDAAMDGAQDTAARHRGSPRLLHLGRCAYLLPTIIACPLGHPLSNREFLFPYASVIQCPQEQIPGSIGPTLAVSAITQDQGLIDRLMRCTDIDRLNIGSAPTWKMSPEQPHEGNVFELLYRRRALQLDGAQARQMDQR